MKRQARLRDLVIELVVYGSLVTLYFLVVLRTLSGPLTQLFHRSPLAYAAAGLGLILAQGVALDALTSFLLERLGLGRVE